MPFSSKTKRKEKEYWTNHYEKFLKPLIESIDAKIKVYRSKPLRGDIIKEIISSLLNDELVVADLTDANPNVYWELGVRQSFKNGTITIAKEGTKLPFDVSTNGTLFYHPNNHIKNKEFEKHFAEAINDILKRPQKTDSIVLETISGRGSLYEIIQRDETERRLFGIISEYERNREHLGKVIETAKSIREGIKTGFPTRLFRLNCAELLITNRYLSGDEEFYELIEEYYGILVAINARLPSWPTREKEIAKWILKIKERTEKTMREFLIKLKEMVKNMKE